MVTSLEAMAMTAFVNNVMAELFKVIGINETYNMLRDLEHESQSLKSDLSALAAAVDDEIKKRSRGASRTAVARAYSIEMRDLMHDVEDCIERFLHRVTAGSQEGARWLSLPHGVKTLWSRNQFSQEIKVLKRRLKEARERVLTSPGSAGGDQPSRSRPPGADHAAGGLVGIEKPVKEVMSLLDLGGAEAKVVAIAGFGGVGKTTLAKAVFDTASSDLEKAWVGVRSLEHGDAQGILTAIHRAFLPEQEYDITSLTNYLNDNKRYLIVIDDIDDIDEEQWDIIKSSIQGNRKGSKIVVTTTIRSTANKRCNESNGHVYQMRNLEKDDSKAIALNRRNAPELVQGSETLLKKCDGLPLALVSVARQLNAEDEPTGAFCTQLCSNLGSYLDREYGEPNFSRLREVIMDTYTGLPDLTVRTCLLYLGIFPTDRPLNKNVIIRRWLAEGYALSSQKVANENFKTFIDRHIIQSVDTRNNAEAKTCKTQCILHEFLEHRSMCEKFIMTKNRAPRGERVRHLFVHGDAGNDMNIDLSCVRSLTVRGNGGGAISNLTKYYLMRVLDLQECTGVNNSHVKKIYKLWNLRYLSLPSIITALPKGIAKLKLLETLAMDKAALTVLPVEVISLPCLIHLIGKFKLKDQDRTGSELEQLSRKSKLEKLAGFVADGRQQGFLQLMLNMKKLRKVKIWCESTVDINLLKNDLWKAIQQYSNDDADARSLTIDFQELARGYLPVPENLLAEQQQNYLTSLKLHGGDLSTLHEFISTLANINKLSLSSMSVARDLLSTLSKLRNLVYLELTAHEIESFDIEVGTFESLRRLRLVTKNKLVLTRLPEGALPELVSLHLICKHQSGTLGIDITNLKKLQEIRLHPEIMEPARNAWEEAAGNHPNRPTILVSTSADDPVGDDQTENPVGAPGEPAHEDVHVSQEQSANEAPGPSSVQGGGLCRDMGGFGSTHPANLHENTNVPPQEAPSLERPPKLPIHRNKKFNNGIVARIQRIFYTSGERQVKRRREIGSHVMQDQFNQETINAPGR